MYKQCSVNVSYGDGADDGDSNLGIQRKMGNRTVLRSSDCQNHREMKRIKYSKEEER